MKTLKTLKMEKWRIRWLLTTFQVLFSAAACLALPVSNAISNSGTWRPHPDWDFDGKRILGHIGNDIFVWDAATGAVLKELKGHNSPIYTLQFTPDGRHVLSSSGLPAMPGDFSPCEAPFVGSAPKDVSTRLWNLDTGMQLWKLDHQLVARLSSDGIHLLTFAVKRNCELSSSLVMWDTSQGRQLYLVPAGCDSDGSSTVDPTFDSVSIAQDNQSATCENDWTIMSFDLRSGRVLYRRTRPETGTFNAYSYSSEGKLMAIANHTLTEWSREGGVMRKVSIPGDWHIFAPFAGWMSDAHYLLTSNPGSTISYGRDDFATVRVVDTESGKVIQNFKVDGALDHVLVSPTGRYALLWTGQESIHTIRNPLNFAMYDMQGRTIIWRGNSDAFEALGFSPDGETVLFGGGPAFEVRDTASGKLLSSENLLGDKMGGGFGNGY